MTTMTIPVSNLDALDAPEPYDVCVIGAGLSGTALALRLVRAGLRVLLVDAAPERALGTRTAGRCEISGDTHYGRVARRPWDRICERLERSDFRAHPYDGRASPWPIGYADLEPHYRAAEQMLRVRGPSCRPDRFLPSDDWGRADRKLEALIRQRGMEVRAAALATPGDGRGFLPARELLPELVASRGGTLVTGIAAGRLRTDANGRIVGALCRAPDGSSKTARANAYVIAAGAIETPRLLLLSRSQRFPLGLGNERDRVGRGFGDQALVTAYGRLDERAGWPAASRPMHADQFHRMFRREGLGSIHPFLRRTGPLEHATRLGAGLFGKCSGALAAARTLSFAVTCRVEMMPADANRVTLSLSARDAFGDPAARIDFNYCEEDLRLLAKARGWLERWLDRFGTLETVQGPLDWAASPAGTCRMGTDPRTSVCDSNLRVHTTPNLYVCGAAALPRVGALPHALTVTALASRLADHIAARARWCARASARPQRVVAARTVASPIPLVRRKPQHK